MSYYKMASFAKALMVSFVLLIGAVVALLNGPALESKYYPARKDFAVVDMVIDGNDLIVTGKLYVSRQCKYIPPPLAKTADGEVLLVTSLSPPEQQRQTWLVGETYIVGPWRINNGKDKDILLYHQHQCHKFWPTLSKLGTISK